MAEQRKTSNIVNAVLYSIESITAILFVLVSSALIARHFGPEAYARYSVVQSVSTMLMVFVTLGLDQFIIRELVRNPHDDQYVSSVFGGLLLGWLAYVALIVGYYVSFKDFSRDMVLIGNVVVGTFFLKVVFVRSYLQARNQPRVIANASLVSRVISVIYLLAGSHFDFSFNAMMMYMPIQAFVLVLGMSLRQPEFYRLIHVRHFSLARLYAMVREAMPVFVSGFLYYFYNQSDVLIMSTMLDPATVGLYSAAIRIIPQAAFVGYVVVATFYTEMDRRLLADRADFDRYLQSVLTLQFGVGIILAAGTCFAAGLIINVLYGPKYAQSASVLAISCWAWVFLLPAALYSRILIMLGYIRYELGKMLIVAPLIVALNYWTIPRYGMTGCAVIFVFSYVLVDFLIYFVFKDTRSLAMIGVRALLEIFTNPRRAWTGSVALLRQRH